MRSSEYREIIRKITLSAVRKRFPSLKNPKEVKELANTIAINIHARMYGANVDGVDSPLWRDCEGEWSQPDKTAQVILEEN